MLCLAIHVYKHGSERPTSSVRVPLAVVSTLAKLIPAAVFTKLQRKGVDLEHVVQTASTRLEPGLLMDITDKDDRVVITLEHMRLPLPPAPSGAKADCDADD